MPKLAARHLGLPITGSRKPITLLGGLTSFGGPGNNYSLHVGQTTRAGITNLTLSQALTEMVRQLRKGNGQHGLVLANGGVLTYQHAVCLSCRPRRSAYPDFNPFPVLTTDVSVPIVGPHVEAQVETQVEGAAVVEVSMSG